MNFRSFHEIRGQRLLIEQLMRPVKTGRIIHAQIFAGPSGIGKRSAAELIAQALNCTGGGEKPCLACPSCHQFMSANSPNLLMLAPEKNAIRVDAVRGLIDEINIRPAQGGVVCVIVEDADKMNENAQNALLKTLEETPDYAAFFLICEKVEALLPTIRSRCALVRFAPLPVEACAEVLEQKGFTPERARTASAEADGCPGQALQMLADESYAPLRERVLRALCMLRAPGDVADAFSVIQGDKDDAARILRMYESACTRLMHAQVGAGEMDDETRALDQNGVRATALLQGVIEANRMLKANVAYSSVMETLFFDLVSQEDHKTWQP